MTGDRRLVQTWYRSLTPDGKVWCETRSRDELLEMSHPTEPLTYSRLDIYETDDGWQPWTPDQVGTT